MNDVIASFFCRGSGIRTHDPLLPKQEQKKALTLIINMLNLSFFMCAGILQGSRIKRTFTRQ